MNRNIRRNALIIMLITGALITGCADMGADEGHDPPTPGGSDTDPQSEEVQNPGTGPEDEDKPEEVAGTDMKPVDEDPSNPDATESPVNSPVSVNPASPPAETPNRITPQAIQPEPADPGLPPDQSVVSGPAVSLEWALLASADVTGDGLEENIYLDRTEIESGSVTLRVCDRDGNEMWNEGAGTAHAGWNSLFLYEEGGKHCLLRYNPYMGQGSGSYTYILFLLEGADENVIGGDLMEFDTNGTQELDVPRMVYFAETVNSLLGESLLLVSSEGGEFAFGPAPTEPFFERYSWLDAYPELFEADDDLAERLTKYSEAAIERRNRF